MYDIRAVILYSNMDDAWGKQPSHLKDRQADLTRLAGERITYLHLCPPTHPPGLIRRMTELQTNPSGGEQQQQRLRMEIARVLRVLGVLALSSPAN